MSKVTTSGIVVATILPFEASGAIDWASYRRFLEYCITPDEVSTVFVNGHAGESTSLSRQERIDVIKYTKDYLQGSRRLISGVIAASTSDAIEQARDAEEFGADGVVLFPPPAFSLGGTMTSDAPLAFFRAVIDAVSCPVSIFQFPWHSNLSYSTETLLEICKLPRVDMVKEGSGTIVAYEDNYRAIKAAAPHISVMPTGSAYLFSQTAIGSDGILSGFGSLAPHFLADLWQAAQANDLAAMRVINDRYYPLLHTIYGIPPRMDQHTRMKVGLKHMGIIETAIPRGPLLPIKPDMERTVVAAVEKVRLVENVKPLIARKAS